MNIHIKKKNTSIKNDISTREWHHNFINYTENIVSHINYNGLFFERGKDSRVKWVIAGKSKNGKLRRAWWDSKCKIHNIKIEAGCYSKIALHIHPTKKHTCQICGNELSLEYVYPNKRTIESIYKTFNKTINPFTKDIFEIIDDLKSTQDYINKFKNIFNISNDDHISSIEELNKYIKIKFVDSYSKSFLSPGAMSNSPDRFDGFHSDGACCRHISDKGRHKTNLQRYGQDRRVYENWSDGDWKMADRLMSQFRNHGISADHIGPISLGFCHRPKFHPLSKEENSAKNNRMSLADISVLIEDENNHEQVISWHSKFIWDKLKHKVECDKDAIKLSDLMRKNMHHVLILLSMIDDNGCAEFLKQYLNPEYSFYDHKFETFDPKTGKYTGHKIIPLKGQNQKNNVDRYYRIAFEKLNEYKLVDNRKVNGWNNEEIDRRIIGLTQQIKASNLDGAKHSINQILEILADLAVSNW